MNTGGVTLPEDPPARPVIPAGSDPGEVLYDQYCELCHGDDGKGYAADNANALSNVDFLASASDAFMRLAIYRGRPGTPMAAYSSTFGGPLTPQDVEHIIAYLRGFQKGQGVPVDQRLVDGTAAAGKTVYDKDCSSCHGPNGEGKTAPSVSNPLFLASASDGFIRYAIERGRRGTPMPSFAEALTPVQIDDVTRYIRTMTRNVDTTPPSGEVPPSFDTIVINKDGPQPEFSEPKDGRYLPAAEIAAALKSGARMVLLDARPTSDWLKSHIPGALPVPYYTPKKMIGSLPKDGTWIISYCGCPHAASGRVMDVLRDEGFDKTAVLDEGIFFWMAKRYPLTFGATP
jgi:cytochrome c oxidase cbb3-type subunit 3